MLCFFRWYVHNPLPPAWFFIGNAVWLKNPPSKQYYTVYFMIRPALGLAADAAAARHGAAAGYNCAAFNAHLPLKPLLSDWVPDIVGHFMTSEVVEMFLFYSVGVFTLQRLPCNFLEPSTALNIESLSGPIQRVAFPLLQTQYIY